MKRTIFLILVLFGAICASFAQIKITKETVNFRTLPSIKENVICKIPKGTQVEVVQSGLDGGWVKISYKQKLGYVSGKCLRNASVGSNVPKQNASVKCSTSANSKTKTKYTSKPKQARRKYSSENNLSAPDGATAECNDGTYSYSNSRRGTCSHHGGVKRWLR